jgi:hypothetical protein
LAPRTLASGGDGSFQSAVNYTGGSHPWSVAVGDLNGYGFPDLAVGNDFTTPGAVDVTVFAITIT